jgi:hypothetical protein
LFLLCSLCTSNACVVAPPVVLCPPDGTNWLCVLYKGCCCPNCLVLDEDSHRRNTSLAAAQFLESLPECRLLESAIFVVFGASSKAKYRLLNDRTVHL